MMTTLLIEAKTKMVAKGVAGRRRVEYQCFPLKTVIALNSGNDDDNGIEQFSAPGN
jgi:hypothetical protein